MTAAEADDLERVVLLQRLKPDATEEYVAAHEDVPDSVVEAMRDGGVENYDLYVHDDIAVSVMDVRDLEEFEAVYESDPDNQAWEERVGQFKRSGIDADDMEIPTMERIWSLSKTDD
ncbi:L-rhamnose mutarotase [Halosimplex sp. J119]